LPKSGYFRPRFGTGGLSRRCPSVGASALAGLAIEFDRPPRVTEQGDSHKSLDLCGAAQVEHEEGV
jgi:hypothetical protein